MWHWLCQVQRAGKHGLVGLSKTIAAELVLSLLAQGVTPEAILDDYPDLEPNDIRACTAYAHAVVARDTLSAVTVAER